MTKADNNFFEIIFTEFNRSSSLFVFFLKFKADIGINRTKTEKKLEMKIGLTGEKQNPFSLSLLQGKFSFFFFSPSFLLTFSFCE